MGLFSNCISAEKLRAGDHIYSWRSAYAYAHHGIYCGDSKVIHFTRAKNQNPGTELSLESMILCSSSPNSGINGSPCVACGFKSEDHGVVQTCLKCFLDGGFLYLFQYGVDVQTFFAKLRGGTCTMAASDKSKVVLHRALSLLQHGFGEYSLFENNCEDFAVYCKTALLVVDKTKLGLSSQSSSVFGATVSALLVSPLNLVLFMNPLAVAGLAVSLYSAGRYASDLGTRSDTIKLTVEDLVLNLQFGKVTAHHNAMFPGKSKRKRTRSQM